MQEVLGDIERFAPSNATVLFTGETGTGKEVAAEALCQSSPRGKYGWVVINCPAIPATLAESTLFGHERGAFTGAVKLHKGLIEQAHGKTLFLDEVSKLSLKAQAKLLRTLEGKVFTRVGGNQEMHSDFRAVAATNRDLRAMVGQGEFLEDLYYRLNVVTIHIPPLRERPRDVMPLARHFVSVFANGKNVTFARESEDALQKSQWQGNVRELKHAIERAMIGMNGEHVIRPHHLWSAKRTVSVSATPPTGANDGAAVMPEPATDVDARIAAVVAMSDTRSFWELIQTMERAIILHALEESRGSIQAAAKKICIERATLSFKMRKLGIQIERKVK
jgi:sigma-54 specific flagellar transcriptional regulator A